MKLDPHLDAIRALVARTATMRQCPSIAWGIVYNGQLLHADGHGTLDTGERPTAQTVYRIASMTKSFTAAAILLLRDAGALSLDDPITAHAPELNVPGSTQDAGPIRIRHLLTMSSGIANDDAWLDRHMDISEAGLDALLAQGVLFAGTTGSVFEYSNLGYGLLGRIARRITGQPIQGIISERLLAPLRMTQTTWTAPEHGRWAQPHRVVDGVVVPDALPPLADGELAPLGGLWSSVADLARWVSWFDDAFPARDDADSGPLCRASRREIQQMHRYIGTEREVVRAAPHGYGYGLLTSHDHELGRMVEHSGGLPGYGSNMRWLADGLADRRVGVIALSNVTYAPMAALTHAIMRLLRERGAFPSATVTPSAVLNTLAQRLVALLGNWDDAAADALFTDNVALDEPYARRRIQAAQLVADCGGQLHIERVHAERATSGHIELTHPSGTAVRLNIQVAPIKPPRIQLYERD